MAGERPWSVADGNLTVSDAFLGLLTDLVSASAEQQSELRDRHDRVPAGANALVLAGQERDLLLQQVAADFRDAVIRAAGSRPMRVLAPWPDGHRWAAGLSHDLDVVDWWPLFTGLRLTELIRHRDPGRILKTLGAAMTSMPGDPVLQGITTLLEQGARIGAPSTWFVLCGTPTPATFAAGDLTWNPEGRRARAIYSQLVAAGHEIGLHGSFETSRRPAAFAEQRARLAQLTGETARGVRQHFVKLRPGVTHLEMSGAGFEYDATMGFSDRNGFRLGVADVVPCWSHAEQTAKGPDLIPFAWMDRTLSKYSGVERPEAWIEDGLELAARCREAEGMWAGIWHPNLVPPLGFPGAPQAYAALLDGLAGERPWFATHAEICDWRRARRSARAVAIDAAGTVVAQAPGSVGGELRLELPGKTPLEVVSRTR